MPCTTQHANIGATPCLGLPTGAGQLVASPIKKEEKHPLHNTTSLGRVAHNTEHTSFS